MNQAGGSSHAEVTTSNWRCFADREFLFRTKWGPYPVAMPARQTGGRSIWIRRRETVRPGALWCRSRKDRRQVFHETGGARIEVVLDGA